MDPMNLILETAEILIDEYEDESEDEEELLILARYNSILDEEENNRRRTRRRVPRNFEEAHDRLFKHYFAEQPVYLAEHFRRRFRMRRELFMRIVDALENHSNYFKQRYDATGKKGISPLIKCTVAIRQLAYGGSADQFDEYLEISECTGNQCLKNFCQCIIEVFGPKFLRKPNNADVERLLNLHLEHHGFPGMLGSIDCMHWKWKNCPVAWRGQFTRGDHGAPTIMLEAVASKDLWIWHAFFGVAGSNNDINVLNQSPLFNDFLQGSGPNVQFMVNGNTYKNGYYLADGIYPEWATLVKSFSYPEDDKRKKFKEMQEAARKDVERAFGVLQSRWAIIRGPARMWHKKHLTNIIYACIIMHNMIVEDEKDDVTNWYDEDSEPPVTVTQGSAIEFQQYLQKNAELRDREVHHRLRTDLVEHIWEHYK